MTTEEYFTESDFSVDVFKKKYAVNDKEQYEDAVDRVTKNIAKMENYDENKEKIIGNNSKNVYYWWHRWKNEILDDIWKPAGSIMAATGSPVAKQSTANCTTVAINGDTLEDIAEARYKVLKFAAYREGIGVDFTPLRPAGSKVNNSAKVSVGGSINWMSDFNDAANHVGQENRVPALLFSLHDDHPDFPEFIKLKSDLTKIPNANISVQISDAFMNAVANDDEWVMTFKTPHETIIRKEKALKLFDMLVDNNLKFAEPGIQFRDTIHRFSNSDYVDWPVISSNACSEKFLDPSGACNLCSLNFEKIPTDKNDIDNFFKYYMPGIVRFMDDVISYEEWSKRNPIEEQKVSQKMLRRLGIGFTNLHAWLLKAGVEYGSKKSVELLDFVMHKMMYYAYKSSIELGKEKGSFKAFNKEKFIKSPYVQMMMKDGLEFDAMRNVELLAVAPSGSLSTQISKPVLSYGIEPAFGLYYWKRTRISGKYEYYFIVPNIVYEILKENGVDLKEHGLKKLTVKDDFAGTKGKPIAKLIDKYKHLFKFKPAREITVDEKLNVMATVAKYIDSSISTTYILSKIATKKDVKKIIFDAWKNKIKSIAIYRDSTRYGIVEFIPFKQRVEELYKQGYKLGEYELSEDDLKQLSFNPFEIKTDKKFVNNTKDLAKIYKFKAEGNDKFYVILKLDETEIFITNYKIENRANEHLLALANKLGKLVKEKNEKKYYKQLERSENTLNKFTRMLSTALKLELKDEALEILEEYAFVGNLAWYLTHKIFKRKRSVKTCPVCGTKLMDFAGCWKCPKCGYEKCE